MARPDHIGCPCAGGGASGHIGDLLLVDIRTPIIIDPFQDTLAAQEAVHLLVPGNGDHWDESGLASMLAVGAAADSNAMRESIRISVANVLENLFMQSSLF